jgi:outer membrane protein TolC
VDARAVPGPAADASQDLLVLPLPCPSPSAGPSNPAPPLPVEPSALRPDAQPVPIDLPTALRVANAANPTIGVALARVREAYALWRAARVLWLPDLETGPAYARHDGVLQNSTGIVFATNKWSLFEGGGAATNLETANAFFGPQIARRLLEAQRAAAAATTSNVQLDVALTYLDLLRAYGALAINAEALANAEEIARLAEAGIRAGLAKTPADPNRARTEVSQRRQERIRLEGDVAAVSARLAQLLLLEPTVQLRPAEPAVVPIAIVPPDVPLEELVATGLMNRPELAESRSLVAANLARWRQARLGPLFPRLNASYLAGDFGGGINDNTQEFRGRGDGQAQAVWTLHNLGFGDLARARAARAVYDQANLHVQEVQAQVAAEVTGAANLALSRQRTLDSAQQGVQQAEEMWRRLVRWTIEIGAGSGRRYEIVELLLGEQALEQARLQYLSEVIEYDQQQFRLYWAMGQPPLHALPKAAALPVVVPVTPSTPAASPTLPSPRPPGDRKG